MSAKIVAEVWDEKSGEYEAEAAFDTFDVFYAHALKFKKGDPTKILRVHIPGGFHLSAEDNQKIQDLGIERI